MLENKKNNIAVIIFYVSLVLVTLAAIFFILYNVARPFKITKIDNMKQTDADSYLAETGLKTDDGTIYYVYITTSNETKNGWYEEIVVEYADYARLHSTATPIYHMNFDSKILNKIGTATTEDSLPGLILVKDGSISQKYFSYSKLNNELTTAMGK